MTARVSPRADLEKPAAPCDPVRYFDGDRWRLGVVYSRGRAKIRLLDLGRLRDVALPKAEAAHFKPVEDLDGRHLARSIEQNARHFRRTKRRHAGGIAKRVAAMLRAP